MADFPPLPGVRRIAVLPPSAVGDFVFALPCLHALRSAYPDARITYIDSFVDGVTLEEASQLALALFHERVRD